MSKKKIFERYYSVKPLIAAYPDASYYMIYGERSKGKSYSVLEYILERAALGEQSALVRRYEDDFKQHYSTTLFDGHIEHGTFQRIITDWDSYIYKNHAWWFTRKKDDGIEIAPEPFLYAFALSREQHYKGSSFPKIKTIFFDEFIALNNGYFAGEYDNWHSIASTIIRLKDDVKIFMAGNTIDPHCVYFSRLGLKHARFQKENTVEVYEFGKDSTLQVVVERTENSSSNGGKPSDKYFAFDDPHLKMITGGDWMLDIYPRTPEGVTNRDVLYSYFIEYDNDVFQCDIVSFEGDVFTNIHPKTTQLKNPDTDLVFSQAFSPKYNRRRCLSKPFDKFGVSLWQFFKMDKVFYSDNVTGNSIDSYLIWCEKEA